MDMTDNQPDEPEDQALLAFLDAQRDAMLSIVEGAGRGGVAAAGRAVGLDTGSHIELPWDEGRPLPPAGTVRL